MRRQQTSIIQWLRLNLKLFVVLSILVSVVEDSAAVAIDIDVVVAFDQMDAAALLHDRQDLLYRF